MSCILCIVLFKLYYMNYFLCIVCSAWYAYTCIHRFINIWFCEWAFDLNHSYKHHHLHSLHITWLHNQLLSFTHIHRHLLSCFSSQKVFLEALLLRHPVSKCISLGWKWRCTILQKNNWSLSSFHASHLFSKPATISHPYMIFCPIYFIASLLPSVI